MNWRKIGKVSLYILLSLVLLISSVIGYLFYQYQGKYNTNDEKYPHNIGYLSPENSDVNKGFTRCNPDKSPIGYYHSSAEFAFRRNKKIFKTKMIAGFDSKNYDDTGFLNIRFLINCKGEIGDIEINELDTNLEKTNLNKELVEQIAELSLKNDNWKPYGKKESLDMYMYLIFKLENGKISEILP